MHNIIIKDNYSQETYFVALSTEQLELINWMQDHSLLSDGVSIESFPGFKPIEELTELV